MSPISCQVLVHPIHPLFQYMYESGFNVFNMGYASAIGVVLILILIVISVIQFIVRHKQGEI